MQSLLTYFRRWHHLQREEGVDDTQQQQSEETILLEETCQRISFVEAYAHRGEVLRALSLYDYMSIVALRRKESGPTRKGEVAFDSSWAFSRNRIVGGA